MTLLRGCAIFALTVSFIFFCYVGLNVSFLKPYWRVIMHDQLVFAFLVMVCFVFLNVTGIAYTACRALSMRTTGTKLSAVDRGLQSGASISQELTKRLHAE